MQKEESKKESVKLLCCPFCGGEAELFQHYPYMRRRVVSSVCCKSCRANSGTWGRKDKAIEAWNTRKPMEAVVAELEKEKGTYFDGLPCEGTMIKINKAISIVRGKE